MSFSHSKDITLKEARSDYSNTSNFFAGDDIKLKKKISVPKKPKPVSDNEIKDSEEIELEETSEEMAEEELEAGLESIINSFGTFSFDKIEEYELSDYEGTESLGNKIRNLVNKTIEFIKDIFRWIYNFFTNKIAKTEAKIDYAVQRKKINGIRLEEVRYPPTIKRLMIPSIISSNPNWVISALERTEKFYKSFLDTNKYLKDVIKTIDSARYKEGEFDLYEWQLKTTHEIGRLLFKGNKVSNALYKTELLPGNRYLNMTIIDKANNEVTKPFFSDSTGDLRLKSHTFLPSSALLDETMIAIDGINVLLKNSQKNVSQINNDFQKEIKKILNMSDYKMANDTKRYFTWVAELNKSITSLVTQYVIHCIDGGLDFYNAGIKNGN